MRIDSIKNGIVIDHIAAGKAKEVYDALDLGKLDCQVAIIMNCRSNKMGKKDIVKIDNDFDVDLDVLGYIDPKQNRIITTHGFRSTFRDWSADQTDYPREVCEHVLAHKLPDEVEAAYLRGAYLEKRKGLMSDWSKYCFS